VPIWPRIVAITSPSVSPRATNPHSHRMILAITSSSTVVLPRYWQNVGVTLASLPLTRIQLCGQTVIERDGARLDDRLPGRQGRLLFAYLVVNRHRQTTRDQMVEVLWPGKPPSSSDVGLNSLISKLRRALGSGALEGRSSLHLQLDKDAQVDVEVADEAVHRAESQLALNEWRRAWGPSLVALFIAKREFLPGEEAPWIDVERRHLAEVRIRALEAYASAAFGTGGTELPAAVRSAQQLVREVPLRESGYQLLMRALACQGNVAEALRVYNDLCRLLRDELGVSPSSATQAVYDDLLTP
jgi:pentatricopeptide repeat protein